MLFPTVVREKRLVEAKSGDSPRDFFYGGLSLRDRGLDVIFGNSRKDPNGALARLRLIGERGRNRLINFGLSRQRIAALKPDTDQWSLALSFTDAFSISLGRYRNILPPDLRLAGGFHGLCDMVEEVKPAFRGYARRHIRLGLKGLDHLFFFGDADRHEAIRRYGIPEEKTSLFLFGVDLDLWRPDTAVEEQDLVLAVGSDPKRDYQTLLAASFNAPLRILTRLPLDVAAGRRDVEIVRGNYHGSPVTDLGLRDLYRAAAVVAVPVRDVFQPSGYSVTLQAMACGKPVVLTRTKGLWDPELFVSGQNCLLVEPGNPSAFGAAVERLLDDASLRRRIGEAARETARRHFTLERMNDSLEALIDVAGKSSRQPDWGREHEKQAETN